MLNSGQFHWVLTSNHRFCLLLSYLMFHPLIKFFLSMAVVFSSRTIRTFFSNFLFQRVLFFYYAISFFISFNFLNKLFYSLLKMSCYFSSWGTNRHTCYIYWLFLMKVYFVMRFIIFAVSSSSARIACFMKVLRTLNCVTLL